MPPRKRDELKTPSGKANPNAKAKLPSGGRVGRVPGLGVRHRSGTKPGAGADRPATGYGLAGSRRKPPDNMRPETVIKPEPEDDTEGGERGS